VNDWRVSPAAVRSAQAAQAAQDAPAPVRPVLARQPAEVRAYRHLALGTGALSGAQIRRMCRKAGVPGHQRAAFAAHVTGLVRAAEFEGWYADWSGVTVAELHRLGRYATPCHCAGPGCEGWRMGHQHDEALAEDAAR
jgi:hypothetical protein